MEFKIAQNTNEFGKIISATEGENLFGKAEITVVEIRSDVIDLKNGEYILKFGMLCPPYCS